MTKYTVLYERTVRVREYETLKQGLWIEFDSEDTPTSSGFDVATFLVDTKIQENLERLRRDPGVSLRR